MFDNFPNPDLWPGCPAQSLCFLGILLEHLHALLGEGARSLAGLLIGLGHLLVGWGTQRFSWCIAYMFAQHSAHSNTGNWRMTWLDHVG